MPKYEQIADEMRRRIADGTLPPGSPYPTQAELMAEFGVSSRVVVDATKLLVAEGLVDSRPGTTSTVRERPTIRRLVRSWYESHDGRGSPWRAEMAAAGRSGDWISQSEEATAPPAVAERLRIRPGDPVMRTHYTFTVDGRPIYLSTSWEPLALTLGTDIVLPEGGPYAGAGVADRMAVIGHRPTLSTEEPEPHTLTRAEAQELGLRAGLQAILTIRMYYDRELPLETAEIVTPRGVRPVYEIPIG